jgi:nucleotide-binding universal stress UspA family protein
VSPTFVLGYDGSPSADAALEQTIVRARQRGGDVVVVFGFYITPWGGTGGGSIREAMEKVGSEALAKAASALEAAGIPVSQRLVEAKPADALGQVAEEVGADTIVVGTVGENPIGGALMGSVVLRLVQQSTVPLLVVPARDTAQRTG